MVEQALIARELLANEGISARVVNCCTIKPIDRELITKCAEETGCIDTAEDHSVIGGFGSAVTEVLCETCPVPVLRVGTEDVFGRSGKVPPLMELYGLTAQNIVDKAKRAVAMKK